MRRTAIGAILSIALALAACESKGPRQQTMVDRVLLAPNVATAPFSRILVVGAAPSRETSRTIELGLTRELEKRKIVAYSFVRDSEATEASEEAVMALVDEQSVDAVLVVSAMLEGATLRSRGEAGDPTLQSSVRGGGGLLNFFRYDYRERTRGEYADYTVDVVLVSDLYEVSSKERVYSVESSTAHAQTSYDIIVEEAKAIVARMHKDRLIR